MPAPAAIPAANSKPTVVPLPLKASGLLPATDNPMVPSAISPFSRAGKGASMRIAAAISASVEAPRSTFTALPGARMPESSAKLRCRPAVSGLTETPPYFEEIRSGLIPQLDGARQQRAACLQMAVNLSPRVT